MAYPQCHRTRSLGVELAFTAFVPTHPEVLPGLHETMPM